MFVVLRPFVNVISFAPIWPIEVKRGENTGTLVMNYGSLGLLFYTQMGQETDDW